MGSYFTKEYRPLSSVPVRSYDDTEHNVILHQDIPILVINRGAKKTILYSHDEKNDIGSIKNYCQFIANTLDVNVITYEYEGFGISKGTPTEINTYEVIFEVYRYILSIGFRNIILYGCGLGTGPTCYLAELASDTKLILEDIFPVAFDECGEIYNNEERLKNNYHPVILINSSINCDSIATFNANQKDIPMMLKEYI